MGLSDLLKKASDVSRTISDLQDAVKDAKGSAGVSSGKAKSVDIPSLPTTLAELQAMPGAKLTDEYAVTALAVAVLCNYENDPDETCRMMDFLRGPQPMTGVDKQFIRDRLKGRSYVIRSYFKGATPDNNYTPTKPYAVEISENSYSREEQGYVKLFVRTSGADSPRPITLRLKPSTGQWFVWQLSLLTDVQKPKESDPWA
jgi:hypothetical protein